MEHPGFFERAGPFPLHVVAERLSAVLPPEADRNQLISDIRALDDARAGHLSFIDNRKYLPLLQTSQASACLVAPDLTARLPASIVAVQLRHPYRAFAQALALLPRGHAPEGGHDGGR